MPVTKAKLTPHPIQLKYIGVKELHIETFVPPGPEVEITDLAAHLKIKLGYDDYDVKTELFPVEANLEIGQNKKKGDKIPFYLRIKLTGIFYVDEKSRNKEKVDFFVNNNALYILHPFLREHVYALSSRCGVKPIVLPLVTIPTSKIEHEKGAIKR